MDYNNLRVVDLKALAREHGLLGYSQLKKAELIAFLQANLQPRIRPPPIPAPSLLQYRAPGLQDLLDLDL